MPLSEKSLWFYLLKMTKCYSYERRDRRPPETCASPGAITHMHMQGRRSGAGAGGGSPPGQETVPRATDARTTISMVGFHRFCRVCVWSESVKSPSKNVRGGGVDAGDVFRSRPQQILQIIRTWRRFPEKESAFFSCRRQILEITQVSKRGLHLGAHFASVSIPRFIIFLLLVVAPTQ